MSKEMVKKVSNEVMEIFSTEKVKEVLRGYFNNNPKDVLRFMSSIRTCMRMNPKLANCSKDSLIDTFLKCAEWGLFPSAETGQCYIIPYGKEASFQLGYQGMIELSYRCDKVKRIDAGIVRKTDGFSHVAGMKQVFKHEYDAFGDRGEPIGAYALAILDNGEAITKVMNKNEIFEFRAKSQGYQRDVKNKTKYSPWQPENDPQLNMWKKTCIRQLFKLLPKTPEALDAFNESEKSDIIDIQPDNRMSQAEIASFFKRLDEEEGYSTDDIKKATKEVLKGAKIESMTPDHAEVIETYLRAQKNEALDKAAAQEEQGELL
jgi:recombination protein RecT